jgi:hypothetical protein
MIVANSIDVIQDHRHWTPLPYLAETAKLALRLLQPLRQETTLEIVSRVGRPLDKDLREGPLLLPQILQACGIRIKVISWDLPDLGVFLEDPPSTPGRAETELTQAFRPGLRGRNRSPGLILGIAETPSRHWERFAYASDRKFLLEP